MTISRRSLLLAIPAPMVIRVADLMPIKAIPPEPWTVYWGGQPILRAMALPQLIEDVNRIRALDLAMVGSSSCHIDVDLRKIVLADGRGEARETVDLRAYMATKA